MSINKYSDNNFGGFTLEQLQSVGLFGDLSDIDNQILLLEDLLMETMYEAVERSLYKFLINFWSSFDSAPFVNNWHIACMCEHIQAALDREIRRLIINVSPRSSKSICSSITSPAFQWTRKPEEKFWLLSHSERLYVQNIIYCRRILEDERYKQRWCNPEDTDHYQFNISTDQNTKTRIENTAGGYILGGAPRGRALGMGFTVAILDDILDSEESYNEEIVRKNNEWYKNTFRNRSNDKENDVIIIVQQRLRENDLTGYVLDKYKEEGWFTLLLPARYDPNRTFVSPIGFNDPRKHKGELLDPKRLPDDFLTAEANSDYVLYQTRYQQNPGDIKEGNVIKTEYLNHTYYKPPENSIRITVWDLSFTNNPTGSYTVGLVLTKVEDKIVLEDMFRDKIEIPEQVSNIKRLKSKYPNSIIGIEQKANGHAVISMLQRELTNAEIYTFNPKLFGGSKEQRIAAILPFLREGKFQIYTPSIVDLDLEDTYDVNVIEKELKSFPTGVNDDIPDCLAYGVQYLCELGKEDYSVITRGEKIRFSENDYADATFRYKDILSKLDYYDKHDLDDDLLLFSDVPDISDLKELMETF